MSQCALYPTNLLQTPAGIAGYLGPEVRLFGHILDSLLGVYD
jgi:hypothetical protein